MATAPTIDLNADLGEGFGPWTLGDDASMLDVVTSANVACGFHAGDPLTIATTVRHASERGVVVGAQVGYRDLIGFGRRFIDVAPEELEAEIIYQIGALDGLCRAAGTSVRYVKPHGALYNTTVHHDAHAHAVVRAVAAYDPDLAVVGLPGSLFLATAEVAGLRTVPEAFADRGYDREGALVPRGREGALLTDPAAVAARVVRLVTEGVVESVDGIDVAVAAETVCTHGDSQGAVAMARAVRQALRDHDITIAPFI